MLDNVLRHIHCLTALTEIGHSRNFVALLQPHNILQLAIKLMMIMMMFLTYSRIWSPIASTTGITKLQTIQNMALRIATGCTSDTNIQHLHNETNILPLNSHLKLHSSQLRQKSQHPTHPLHKFTVLTENERHKKNNL